MIPLIFPKVPQSSGPESLGFPSYPSPWTPPLRTLQEYLEVGDDYFLKKHADGSRVSQHPRFSTCYDHMSTGMSVVLSKWIISPIISRL